MPLRSATRSQFARGPALALIALAAFAAPALASAQTVRNKVLEENPNRTIGGSCIYGGDGRLIHAPHGVACREYEEPPASIAPDAAQAPRPRAGAQPALPQQARAELAALLAERERLDVELAHVREAASYEDREAARRVVDESLRKIARHLENEARVIQPLTVPSGAP
jgi:hypothetical protein